MPHCALSRTATVALTLGFATSSHAGAGFALHGPAVTTGGLSNGQSLLSLSANPAAASFDRTRAKDASVIGGVFMGAGVEYGDVEELFDQYDELAEAIADTNGVIEGISFNAFDPNAPDFASIIAEAEVEAMRVVRLLDAVSDEGYANADAGLYTTFIINHNILGGTLGFEFDYSGSASALSVIDPFNFDANVAQTELDSAYMLMPGDPITTFDLTGGITLTINPSTGDVTGSFSNDSLLAVRAAEKRSLGMSYSYAISTGSSQLHLGVKPKWVQMGLSRVVPRIGDITDSEALFDDIRDAEKETSSNFSLDVGALWVSQHLSLGVSAEDVLEPEFDFNEVDTSSYSAEVAAVIDGLSSYTQEAKISVEASLYTADRSWALSGYYEPQVTTDALGEEHQWMQLSAGWHGDNFWVPNVRLGYRTNRAGSEVSIYSLGVTLFRHLNLDVSSSTDKVTIEGTSLPRGASASLGVTFAF
ncbi:conjugal transfer protein TraF [Simiduia sp. 21SJ11W-1]|uniref:conjugal transfer protein TraF n=1 Tax=Simiduia sp. 21SJ11W-1 TaxID=2909669 RepID=UPI00209EA0EF|nr:conjugal transfer protein TraF [Simiduia sp. 21SJ11W-1]UTA47813.1 conjugal transfer protein TraF [Simiduia sp. 21SJ11W-1]